MTEDFHLKKKILSVLETKESKNAVNYRKKVEEAEATFGVGKKCSTEILIMRLL